MRYLWLDGFRGIAAIAVALWHFRAPLGIPGFACGFLAVDLFFILSGIVLTLRFADELERPDSGPGFAWARFRRLYPMAFIAGVFIAFLNYLGFPSGFAESAGALSTATVVPYPSGHGYLAAFPADPPEWSLFIELGCNLVWFWSIRISKNFAAALLASALPALIVIAYSRHGLDIGVLSGVGEQCAALVRGLAGFGIGYFIARMGFKSRLPVYIALPLFIAACALFDLFPRVSTGFLIIGIGALLLSVLMRTEPGSMVVRTGCRWLGMISFPLYMIHAPAQRLAQAWVRGGTSAWLAYAVVLTLAAVIATLLNEFIFRKLPSRFTRIRRTRST